MITLKNYTIFKYGTEFKSTRGSNAAERDLSKDGLFLEMFSEIKRLRLENEELSFEIKKQGVLN